MRQSTCCPVALVSPLLPVFVPGTKPGRESKNADEAGVVVGRFEMLGILSTIGDCWGNSGPIGLADVVP